MRFGDRRTSDNVEAGGLGGGGFGFGGGGGGGGLFGLLFGLMLSRFGIGGVLILALGYCALSTFGGGLGGGTGAVAPHQAARGGSAAEVCASTSVVRFSCQVLASTEDQWGKIFAAEGQQYQPTVMRIYSRSDVSGCGAASAAMGPFYCPSDQRIYIDPQFFTELEQRFRAAGDFAQAYVIAHEVGHHIQHVTGVLERARAMQSRASAEEGNAIQVRVELQADCYAGVWANKERAALEPGDIEEGMRAAEAIGDDTLQRQSQGRVVPESFTHGSAAQRMQWLRRGLDTGDPKACDTFSARVTAYVIPAKAGISGRIGSAAR